VLGNKKRRKMSSAVVGGTEESFLGRCGISGKTLWNLMLLSILSGALILTYDNCITCVLCIAVVSGLTMSCIPGAPVLFVLSLSVLLFHAIDYRNATVKVEVPLENLVYIPTWDDVHKYVHVNPGFDEETKKN